MGKHFKRYLSGNNKERNLLRKFEILLNLKFEILSQI
jgi:hypothetical protein